MEVKIKLSKDAKMPTMALAEQQVQTCMLQQV